MRWAALPAVRSSAVWPAAAAARLSAPWSERAPAHLLPATVDAATVVIIGIMAIAIITAAAADGTASRTVIVAELTARNLSTRGSHTARYCDENTPRRPSKLISPILQPVMPALKASYDEAHQDHSQDGVSLQSTCHFRPAPFDDAAARGT